MKVSEIGEEIDPVASKRIRTDLYVDDGASGGTMQDLLARRIKRGSMMVLYRKYLRKEVFR